MEAYGSYVLIEVVRAHSVRTTHRVMIVNLEWAADHVNDLQLSGSH